MRFIHTSDWHIGRIFYERSLLEDQEHVLKQFIEVVRESKVDLVIIAGDVYDKPIPPTEAVLLLDWVISELIQKIGCPVLMISGNHDSADRMSFGSRLLSESKLRIISSFEAMERPLVLQDKYGEVSFFGIPYFDPAQVRVKTQDPSIRDHEHALAWCMKRIAHVRGEMPAVAVAHAYVTGAASSESEKPLSIGGSFLVPTELFVPFIYTALGHLHRPQNLSERIRYSGSLLPYHFEEKDNPKSITLVELEADRVPRIQEIQLNPKRKLRVISGPFARILKDAPVAEDRGDFVLVRRDHDGAVLDPMGQLRPHYPNLLAIELAPTKSQASGATSARRSELQADVDPTGIFAKFFNDVTGGTLSDQQLKRLVERLAVKE